jgi:hypothetical protein
MFMKYVALVALLLPCFSYAETYLCAAEAAAVVEDGGNRVATSSRLTDAASLKYIQTQERGKWVVKELGKEYLLFDLCRDAYVCESSLGYGGAFVRQDSGAFSVTWFAQNGERNMIVVAKGRCSKI